MGLNLHPGMGCTHFLPKIVGPQVAARMLLTGELVSGEQGDNSIRHNQFHYFFWLILRKIAVQYKTEQVQNQKLSLYDEFLLKLPAFSI